MKTWMMMIGLGTCCCAWGTTWNVTGTGDWNVPANWKENTLPTASDNVVNNMGTIRIADGMNVVARRFQFGTTAGTEGHLLVEGGSLAMTSTAQTDASAGSRGSIVMTGGTMSVWQLQVGAYGTGTMSLTGGVVTNNEWSCVGRYAGGVGEVTISGTGKWINAGGCLFAGEEGTGTITIENGGEMRSMPSNGNALTIGNRESGKGTVFLKTGGLIEMACVAARYASDTFVLDGGTLRKHTSADTTGFVQGAGAFKIGPAGGTVDTLDKRQTVTIGLDNLSGTAGPLVKTGTGTLVLERSGSFSGGFDVTAGTLEVKGSVNLPNWRTAPLTVRAGATLALGVEWSADEVQALTNRADFVLEEGAFLQWTDPGDLSGKDYVINVPNGTTTLSGDLSFDRRVVKTGNGTLVLTGRNEFPKGVVVSNGTLRADDFAVNLGNTHLQVGSLSANSPAFYALDAAELTVPLGTTAGTIEFPSGTFGGIQGVGSGLVVDFGGKGETISFGTSGLTCTDLSLRANGGQVRLLNRLDMNGLSRTLKSWNNSTLVFEGGITNVTKAGGLFLWDGSFLYPKLANNGVYAPWHLVAFNGTHTFSNATLKFTSDLIAGDNGTRAGVSRVTLKDCTKLASGWDYVNGATGTVMTVDGGTYTGTGEFRIGRDGTDAASVTKDGTFVITNNAQVTLNLLRQFKGRLLQRSGSLTINDKVYLGHLKTGNGIGPAWFEMDDGTTTIKKETQIGSIAGSEGRMVIKAGTMTFSDGANFQIGANGRGILEQTGGAISASGYPCPGRYPGSVGDYRLHGGTFTHRTQGNGLFFIAEEGTGTVSVANGGLLRIERTSGICVASKAGSKGHAILSPDGTLEATRFYGDKGESGVTFNGGTLKLFGANYPTAFLPTSIRRTTVTPLGGAIDTNGKGDFTASQAFTAATRADDLSETMTHRWRFDGDLVDEVGGSTAVVGGTVAWANGAVRLAGTKQGTSCVNLGTDVLPTDGRGVTIELFFTVRELRNWARLLNFGNTANNGKEFYIALRTNDERSVLTTSGASSVWATGGFTYAKGGFYHVAVTFDRQLDGTWRITYAVHDPGTGTCLMRATGAAVATWSLATITQSAGCWLGHSSYAADYDPAVDYHDVRIYNRVLTEDQLVASAKAGCDRDYFFAKKGVGSLTLKGANTYTCGTAVEKGTLKLAEGATIPATPWRVDAEAVLDLNDTTQTAATLEGTGTVRQGTVNVLGEIRPGGREAVGTLTLAGTTLEGGTLRMDVTSDGTADVLAATGTLDVSKLGLSVANPEALNPEMSYTLVTAGAIEGAAFREKVNLPARWSLTVGTSRVRLVYGSGTLFLLR